MTAKAKHREWVDKVWGTDRFPIHGDDPQPHETYGLFLLLESFDFTGKVPDYETVRANAVEFSAAYNHLALPSVVMLDEVPYGYYASSGDHRSCGIHFYIKCHSIIRLRGMGT